MFLPWRARGPCLASGSPNGSNLACTTRVAALAACLALTSALAQTGYNRPPDNILDVMRAPPPPVPMVSPTNDRILLVSWQEYPSITRVATPYLRLAGARVEPGNHSK